METMNWCFEIERLIYIAVNFRDVYKLSSIQALIYPPIANWLNPGFSSCIFLKSLYHFGCVKGVFHHIEAMSFPNLCSACKYLASIFYNLIC